MLVFYAVARAEFRRYATYRAATLAGIFTNTVWGFIKAYIFLAVWRAQGTIGGYDSADAVTFVFLGQALLAPLAMFGFGITLPERIRTGDVVIDLLRPFDFQLWWLAADLGRAGFQLIGRIFPFVAGALVLEVHTPGTVAGWLLFALALVLALVVSFALRYLVSLAVWWVLDARGLETVTTFLMLFLSGLVVPLVILPGPLGEIVQRLPWAAVLQVPADVFLGRYRGSEVIGALAFQLVWALVILAAGRLLMLVVRRGLVAQGG